MQPFSALSLFRRGLAGQKGWAPQWRSPEPKAEYDAVIVGGGGHGLAAAYYLAKQHGLRNIAVLEKGWIGGGNTGRNTTIIRSNYLFDESAALYDHAVKLWEGLSQTLNYNVMFSQRGVLMLAHNVHDVQSFQRHIHANRANGVDNEWLTPEAAKAFCPPLNIGSNIRYPVLGGALQRRGGTARHDAVAWGYARAADALGVDILQNCEVTAIERDAAGAVVAVQTSRGRIRTRKVGVSAAGHTSVVLGRCSPAWSCRTPSTPTSASRTRASWSSAPAPTSIRRTPRGAGSTSTRTPWTRSASSSPSSAGCGCCETGAASWM
jgi:sarcosine oxidase subunit beta